MIKINQKRSILPVSTVVVPGSIVLVFPHTDKLTVKIFNSLWLLTDLTLSSKGIVISAISVADMFLWHLAAHLVLKGVQSRRSHVRSSMLIKGQGVHGFHI